MTEHDDPVVPAPPKPARRVGRRPPATEQTAIDLGTGAESPLMHAEELAPEETKFLEMLISALFGLAALGAVGFVVAYVTVPRHSALGQYMNYALGGCLAVSLLGLGAGLALWAITMLPHGNAVQERHEFQSPPEEERDAENIFLEGAQQMGLGQRKMMRRSLLAASALLPIPAVMLARDFGPLPGTSLRHTGWKKGDKLVDVETRLPYRIGDLEIGSIATVMPEGFTNVNDMALAPTILIRFAPGEIKSQKEMNWGYKDHVAYSKICSHAGCPISLYEQQTHHLLCPCHQSTFDMANDADVIFGPAARRLPQLKISIDPDGFFVAAKPNGYTEPVGPSFWERG